MTLWGTKLSNKEVKLSLKVALANEQCKFKIADLTRNHQPHAIHKSRYFTLENLHFSINILQ